MTHNGRVVTSNRAKANIFMSHYSRIGRLSFSNEEKQQNREAKAAIKHCHLSDPSPQHNPHPPFTLTELKLAITNLKPRGAPGPDNISPSLLQHLGPKALNSVLYLFNLSLATATTPQSWRNATIIPILKPQKPPSRIDSFRPISLTSCIAKTFERILSERLYDLAESNNWFAGAQAGFRKGRGVEDQILRVSQTTWDAFERQEKALLVLLDYSKAYDRIWRQKLLLALLNTGVPGLYVKWLANFLNNRQARVRFNGSVGKSRKIPQGLPQGSVLAPVLFLFYINSLPNALPNNILCSMYADDVSILATDKTAAAVEAKAQAAVTAVSKWSKEWKMELNATKSEIMPLTLGPSWTTTVSLNDTPIPQTQYAKFLGVTFDKALTFAKHVEITSARVARKMNILAAVANSDWGWRKGDLKKVYTSSILSILSYAGSGWQPWLSKGLVAKLERLQNACLRLITAQAKCSPVEARRAETGVPSVKSSIDANCLRSLEKAKRLQPDNPRRLAFEGAAPTRLKRSSARNMASTLSTLLPQHHHSPLTFFHTRPWNRRPLAIFSHLEGVKGKGDDPDSIKSAALSRARAIGSAYNIYTDGSASAGTTDGGAAAVITTGDPDSPTIITTLMERGAPLTCSYEEELRAMHMAADWILANQRNASVSMFSDSQSLCVALASLTPTLDPLRAKLQQIAGPLTIQWIPGHAGIPGNELADAAAKSAAASTGPSRGVSYSSVCAATKRATGDPPIQHLRTRHVYASLNARREREIPTRSDQSLLARLRSGHYLGLRAYRHRVRGDDADPICNLCDEGVEQDLEHWVRCPALAPRRRNRFGENYTGLDLLTRFPLEAIALARESLSGA